jgi:hypothetical protein
MISVSEAGAEPPCSGLLSISWGTATLPPERWWKYGSSAAVRTGFLNDEAEKKEPLDALVGRFSNGSDDPGA